MTAKGAPTPYGELAEVLLTLPLLMREARRARGLSMRSASKEVGVSASTWSRLEGSQDAVMSHVALVLAWLGE